MKTLSEIVSAVEDVRKKQATATAAADRITADIAKIDPRFQQKDRDAEIAEIRKKHLPEISAALNAVTAITGDLSASQAAWQDKEFILSTRPLTSAGVHNIYGPAVDPALEAMSRLSTLQEMSLMSDTMLQQVAADAKGNLQKGALLHFATLVYNSRPATPGREGISLDDVVLPDQVQAMALIQEATGARYSLENTFKGALNGRVDATDKLAAAYMGAR